MGHTAKHKPDRFGVCEVVLQILHQSFPGQALLLDYSLLDSGERIGNRSQPDGIEGVALAPAIVGRDDFFFQRAPLISPHFLISRGEKNGAFYSLGDTFPNRGKGEMLRNQNDSQINFSGYSGNTGIRLVTVNLVGLR